MLPPESVGYGVPTLGAEIVAEAASGNVVLIETSFHFLDPVLRYRGSGMVRMVGYCSLSASRKLSARPAGG